MSTNKVFTKGETLYACIAERDPYSESRKIIEYHVVEVVLKKITKHNNYLLTLPGESITIYSVEKQNLFKTKEEALDRVKYKNSKI